MKTVLLLPLIWIIGYMVTDGEYGAKIINGFEWLSVAYIIMIIFDGIIMSFITFALTIGARVDKQVGIFGAMTGLLMWVITAGIGIFYYWITNEIAINTNVMATQWSELGSTDLMFIYIIIFSIGIFTSRN